MITDGQLFNWSGPGPLLVAPGLPKVVRILLTCMNQVLTVRKFEYTVCY